MELDKIKNTLLKHVLNIINYTVQFILMISLLYMNIEYFCFMENTLNIILVVWQKGVVGVEDLMKVLKMMKKTISGVG